MEITFFEETAPLTEEQWERIIQYFRLRRGKQVAQSLVAAKQFTEGMWNIQRSAGHSQEEFGNVGQSVLDMAKEQPE